MLGAGNFWCVVIVHERMLCNNMYMLAQCVVIAHGRMPSLIRPHRVPGQCMSHFLSGSEDQKVEWAFTTYNDEPMQEFGPKWGGGGGR